MNGQDTKKKDLDAELEALKAMPDEDIDYSDIPPLDDEFWANARLVHPTPKEAISIRLDGDVLDYFKSQGKGYQSRINAVLRSYMEHDKKSA